MHKSINLMLGSFPVNSLRAICLLCRMINVKVVDVQQLCISVEVMEQGCEPRGACLVSMPRLRNIGVGISGYISNSCVVR